MKLEPGNLAAIVAMAVATCGTRLAGLWLARVLRPGPVMTAALDALPVAVLTAVIAPAIVRGGPADMLAATVTALAATRLPLIVTVAIGMAAVIGLRALPIW